MLHISRAVRQTRHRVSHLETTTSTRRSSRLGLCSHLRPKIPGMTLVALSLIVERQVDHSVSKKPRSNNYQKMNLGIGAVNCRELVTLPFYDIYLIQLGVRNNYQVVQCIYLLRGTNRQSTSSSTLLKHYHWLPIHQRISYKLQVKNFGSAPTTKRRQVHYNSRSPALHTRPSTPLSLLI